MKSRLYNNFKLEGKYIDLSYGKYNLTELDNAINDIKSVTIAPFTKITLYSRSNLEGPRYTVSNPGKKRMNIPSFCNEFVYSINSIKVEGAVKNQITNDICYKIEVSNIKRDDITLGYIYYNVISSPGIQENSDNVIQANEELVVIIPDIGYNAKLYKSIQERFVQHRYSSVIMDIRGTGSSSSSNNMQFSEIIQDYRMLLHELNKLKAYKKTIIIGHGIGGVIAQLWALIYKGELNNLILINSTPYGIYNEYNKIDKHIDKFIKSEIDIQTLAYIFAKKNYKDNKNSENHENKYPKELFKKELVDSINNISEESFKLLFSQNKDDTDMAITSKYIMAKTLIVQSTDDKIINDNAGQDLYFLIRNSTYIKLNGGHSPHFTNPERVFEEIFKFISPNTNCIKCI